MQRTAVSCHASCRVQSAISQRFVCFSGYRWLELDDLITHGFERAPPTHNVAVRPIIIFALTFKAMHPVNSVNLLAISG